MSDHGPSPGLEVAPLHRVGPALRGPSLDRARITLNVWFSETVTGGRFAAPQLSRVEPCRRRRIEASRHLK